MQCKAGLLCLILDGSLVSFEEAIAAMLCFPVLPEGYQSHRY